MKCEQFEIRINELLDRRLNVADDQSLVHHAGECECCARFLEGSSLLFDDAFLLDDPVELDSQFDPGYSAHVVEAALAEDSSIRNFDPAVVAARDILADRSERKRIGRWRAWIAVAAALALFASIPIVAGMMADANPQPVAEEDFENTGSDDAQRELAPRTNEHVTEAPRRPFLGPTPFSTGGNIAVTFSVIELPIEEMGLEDMGLGSIDSTEFPAVAPIANTFSALVETLWQSIPSIRSQSGRPGLPFGSLDTVDLASMA